jgi:sarcosine oxidase delta subunit
MESQLNDGEAAPVITPPSALSTQTVTVYTRHNESCSKNGEPYWKRCHCMKYLYVYRENTSRQVSTYTQLGKGGRAGTGNPRILESREGASA